MLAATAMLPERTTRDKLRRQFPISVPQVMVPEEWSLIFIDIAGD
jgi:hypothetical protein